jgi:hypothetical protein
MNWRRLLLLLNLLFILVELCDPTTPFIRISSEPVAKKHSFATVKKQAPQNESQTPLLEEASSLPAPQLEKQRFATGDYHDAVESVSLTIPKITHTSLCSHANTGLKNQYDPDGLIRPPITLVA